MQNSKCKILIAFIFCLFLQMMPFSAFAHKVNVFAYVEGDTVYTESYFPDGRKVSEGLIEVYDTEWKKLLEGKTDKEGQFNFKVPGKGDLKIVLNASLGHRATYTVAASEINPAPSSGVLDPTERCGIKDIAKKEMPEGVSLRDIIAGVGYILGITGMVMFFLSKKKNASARNR